MAVSRKIVIAGAGIGGLTAALALAQRGFEVTILEQTERLEEVGAGIQLSPNATRVLIALDLGTALGADVVVPEELRVMNARSGRVLARSPLGARVARRYGAPYWVIHRADLQAALRDAVVANPAISLQLSTKVDGCTADANGVTVSATHDGQPLQEHAGALIAADGLWSVLLDRLGHGALPRFAGDVAWRTLVPADAVSRRLRVAALNLWLGRNAHVVHYPVRGGRLINVVAITRDPWRDPGWSAPGDRAEILARFPEKDWHAAPRELIAAGRQWQKWALHDRAPLDQWGQGPITLLGDAAHPMLPYLAQGAAMAIEDAAVLASCVAGLPDDLSAALRNYEEIRRPRTTRAQREARRNGVVYHLGGAAGLFRAFTLAAIGGRRLITRYDWLYGWKPD